MGIYKGTAAADVYLGADKFNVFRGRGGDDHFEGSGNVNIAFGGAGNDYLLSNSGRSVFTGGADADTFAAGAGATGRIVITDWQDGIDQIDLSALGITDLSGVSITQSGNRLKIQAGEVKIVLKGVNDPDTLDADDFVFADQPQTVNFDDIDVPGGASAQIANGYGGLNWQNFFVLETDEIEQTPQTSGYAPASGDGVAFNNEGEVASFYRADAFDFESLSLSSAARDDLEVTIYGYLDGELVGSQTVTVAYGTATTYQLDDAIFDQVDHVVFSAEGGTQNPNATNNGTQFGLDDLVIL